MRAVKKVIKLVAAVAVLAALVEVLRRRPAPPSASPTAPPNQWTPVTPQPGPAASTAEPEPEAPAWVEPKADGTCPEGHPVKAKTSSRIFHVPGGSLYGRTSPDRCYASAEAAEADGYRASQR